jgi:hypothetical protein
MTPEEREREQCRQLASELMGGRPVDDGTIDKLNLCIQHQSPRPGALLRRLLEMKARGVREASPESLAYGVRMLHFL